MKCTQAHTRTHTHTHTHTRTSTYAPSECEHESYMTCFSPASSSSARRSTSCPPTSCLCAASPRSSPLALAPRPRIGSELVFLRALSYVLHTRAILPATPPFLHAPRRFAPGDCSGWVCRTHSTMPMPLPWIMHAMHCNAYYAL